MNIRIDRNVVEFKPEGEQETASLEILGRILVDCLKDNKTLNPIGEYIPTKENLARFVIEGAKGGATLWSEEKATEDSTYICAVCNKYMNVKAGGDIPFCCGNHMEAVD